MIASGIMAVCMTTQLTRLMRNNWAVCMTTQLARLMRNNWAVITQPKSLGSETDMAWE